VAINYALYKSSLNFRAFFCGCRWEVAWGLLQYQPRIIEVFHKKHIEVQVSKCNILQYLVTFWLYRRYMIRVRPMNALNFIVLLLVNGSEFMLYTIYQCFNFISSGLFVHVKALISIFSDHICNTF
jgi:hypothetical protein